MRDPDISDADVDDVRKADESASVVSFVVDDVIRTSVELSLSNREPEELEIEASIEGEEEAMAGVHPDEGNDVDSQLNVELSSSPDGCTSPL